jgi:uncharacterized protein YebE (UPF0316 family)
MDDSQIFSWIILPILIFFARILDQSIGTMRLIFLSKGMRLLAPILGFFEVIIWLLAVSQIMKHLDNWLTYVAYGAGFAMGNYIGIRIEEKLSLGTAIIRVILPDIPADLILQLSEKDFGLTMVDAAGSKGPVKILLSTIRRKEIQEFTSIINTHYPQAFYTIEEVKSANKGIFSNESTRTIFGSFAARVMKAK